MGKKFARYLLIFFSLFLIVGSFVVYEKQLNFWLGINHINELELKDFIENKEYLYIDNPLLKYNGNEILYVKDFYSYFITGSINNITDGKLDGSLATDLHGFKLMIVNSLPLEEHIEKNIPLKICIYDEFVYDLKDLRITCIPIMSIDL